MPTPIQNPAGYVPSRAMTFADQAGNSAMVSAAAPLPVTTLTEPPAPLVGSTSGNTVAGPFIPALGRALMLCLSGTWTGSVRLLRSTDGGTTRLPVTLGGSPWAEYDANCCEAVWEELDAGASLHLDIALTSGTLNYRLA